MAEKDNLYEIYLLDSDGEKHLLDPTKAELSRPRIVDKMESRELKMTFDRDQSIKELDRVMVKKLGVVIFRGYVKFIEISSKYEKNVRCFGLEDLLLYRVAPIFFYDKYTDITIRDLVSDVLADGKAPGLLAAANSYVLPGISYMMHGTENIVILDASGTNYCFGENRIFAACSYGLGELEEMPSLAQLVASSGTDSLSFYRDSYRLYIDVGTDNAGWWWYEAGGLYVDGHKDTGIRLGQVDATAIDLDLVGTLMTNWNKIGDLIVNIVASHGLFVTISDDENFTYLNILSEEGRESASGVYTLYEEDLVDLKKKERDEPIASALCGRGIGLQYFTLYDHSPTLPVRIESVVDFAKSWKDADGDLVDRVTEEYKNRTTQDQWILEPVSPELVLMPSDWLRLYLDFEPTVLGKIEKIEEDCLDGHMTIDLSEHRTTENDVWSFLQEVDEGYTDQYPRTVAPASSSVVMEADEDEGVYIDDMGHYYFWIPDGAMDTDIKPRMMLSLSIAQGDTEGSPTEADVMGRLSITIYKEDETPYLELSNICLGEASNYSIPEIDITQYLIDEGAVEGDDATVWIKMHAADDSVPSDTWFTSNATLNFYKRSE